MARTGILRRLGIGFLALVSVTSILGGCSGQKKQLEAAQAALAECKEENATLSSDTRNKDTRIAELEKRVSEINTQPASQPIATNLNDPMPSGGGQRSSGGGGDVFTPGSDGRPVAHMSGDVLFDPGQAVVKSGAKKKLDSIASEIKRKYSGHGIRVEGYTDTDKPKKSAARYPTNEALSEARAEAVRSYLSSKGVSSGRIEAVGMGAAKPKATKAASRRVDVIILK